MKKKLQLKRKLATFAALLCLMTMMPLSAAGETKPVVNVVEKTGKITQTSTLYVGEVVLDGQQSFYYLYSEDLTNSETVFATVRDGLSDFKDGTYSALVSNIIGTTEELGISICSNSAYQSIMNSDWKQTEKAGLTCLPTSTVISSSSENLYETNAEFAAKCVDNIIGVSIVNDAGVSQAISGILGKLSTSITDDVTYTVIDGELVKLIDRHISYTYELVTVIYTKVELATASNPDLGDVNGDGKIDVSDVVCMVNYILENPVDVFIFENADIDNNTEVNITDVTMLVNIILSRKDE